MIRIYKIENKENGMVYIGQTSRTIEERFSDHKKPHQKNRSENLLYKDMYEYGLDSFSLEEIDTCEERHKFIIERHWIHYYADKGYPMYNIMEKEDLNSKQRWSQQRLNNGFDYQSDEFKQTMSTVTSGKNNGMYNRKGKNAVNGRNVIAYDKDKNVVHEFVSVREALKFLKLKSHSGLNKACRNGTMYKGYYWKKEWKEYYKE